MSERFLCVVGDPTTGGGQALTGAAGFDLECLDGVLRPVVRVGDPVLCGQCGPTQVVSGVEAFWVSGPLVAADGSELACGHKLVAKLQRGFSVTDGTSARRGDSRRLAPAYVAPSDAARRAFQALDGDLIVDARDHDLPVAGIARAFHRDEVAVEDAFPAHRIALHAQQVIGRGGEQRAIDVHLAFDAGIGADGRTGGDPAEDGEGQAIVVAPGFRPARGQPDSARLVRPHLQTAGLFQPLDVLVRRTGLAEAERIGDLLQRRRQAFGVGVILDEGEDLRLAGGEVGHRYGPG